MGMTFVSIMEFSKLRDRQETPCPPMSPIAAVLCEVAAEFPDLMHTGNTRAQIVIGPDCPRPLLRFGSAGPAGRGAVRARRGPARPKRGPGERVRSGLTLAGSRR
jgi:hypothetical protein